MRKKLELKLFQISRLTINLENYFNILIIFIYEKIIEIIF